MRRHCDYTDAVPAPTPEDFAALQLKLQELETRLNTNSSGSVASLGGSPPPNAVPNYVQADFSWQPSSGSVASLGGSPPPNAVPNYVQADFSWQPPISVQFPASLFLDLSTWKRMRRVVPKPVVEIPEEVLAQLGEPAEIQQTINEYFVTIHLWLPIISKSRMQNGHSLLEGGSDLAMLFLAVKLVTTVPIPSVAAADHYIYLTAKRFVLSLEHGGVPSIMVLQSMVLIAIYEYSHGIYPAAWTTIGGCARYADFLGLPDVHESSILLNSATTWVELEERRRTWWAIVQMIEYGTTIVPRWLRNVQSHPCLLEIPAPSHGFAKLQRSHLAF
ncbi:Transcription factor BOA15 like protein [Verticillium longisporum]|uniref:Transcription factor BOA15 like protein n=1 Tax=Verticillium longisporum TaxID=100787 RepID=A0A8I2ZIK6_VERLO|nr:Transcription factor BOA15 like protein [Verticillium longisporum]